MKKFTMIAIVFAMLLTTLPLGTAIAAEATTDEDLPAVVTVYAAADATMQFLGNIPSFNTGAWDTLITTFQSNVFMRFDASAHVERREELERATLRLFVHGFGDPSPGGTLRPLERRHHVVITHLLWDPWRADDIETGYRWADQLWSDNWNEADGTLRVHYHNVANTMGNMERNQRYPRSVAALEDGRAPMSIVTTFGMGRFVVGTWHEIDITDYVRSSMESIYTGEGTAPRIGVTGSGLGRGGQISLGMVQSKFSMGGDTQVHFSSSVHANGNGPQIVLEFAGYDSDVTSTESFIAIDNATISRMPVLGPTGNESNFFQGNAAPLSVSTELVTRRWGNNVRMDFTPYTNDNAEAFIDSFVKFDIDKLLPEDDKEIFDVRLRLHTLGGYVTHLFGTGQASQVVQPRVVGVSIAGSNWGNVAQSDSTGVLNPLVYAGRAQIFDEHAAPGMIASFYNPPIGEAIYMDVTNAVLTAIENGESELTFMLNIAGVLDPWARIYIQTTFASIGHQNEEFHPQLVVRYVGDESFECDCDENCGGEDCECLECPYEPTLLGEFKAINIVDDGAGVTLDGVNTTDTEVTAVVILAMYNDEGRMLNVFVQGVSIAPGTVAFTNRPVEFEGQQPSVGAAAIIRAFLWDSTSTMVPLLADVLLADY